MQPATEQAQLLEIRGLTKGFPGVQALDHVDFTLHAGEIHGLLGENGAGKSTLIKVLTGVFKRDAGTIRLEGQEIAARDTADALSLGIGTVYQEVNLLPNMSVAENLFIGRQPQRFGLVRTGEMRRRALELLAGYGLDIDVANPLGSFSVAVQQIVAIARAVDLSAKVLILDEPTASLDAQEVETLFGILKRLKSRGMGIVFVTHFLDQVYAVCDRITVLRNGRLVGSRPIAELPRIELVSMMLGRELAAEALHRNHRKAAAGEPLVAFKNYGKNRLMEPFDLAVRSGEVVGLAGLLGSGRTETAKLIFGIERADSGQAFVDGKPVRIASPRDAARLRFGFTPEDRKTEGIIAELSIRENIILALQAQRGWLHPLPRRRQDEIASRFIKLLDIRTPDAEKPIGLLSGGNQQKALLARWLATEPRFLILDEPTRGIDVGAKAEIEKLIGSLRADGMAILFICSELEELVRTCERVAVLRDRTKVGELSGPQVQESTVMHTIAGGAAHA